MYLALLKGETVGPSWCTEKNLSVSLFITNHDGLALDRTWASVVHKRMLILERSHVNIPSIRLIIVFQCAGE